jgi:SRSO17 transposase
MDRLRAARPRFGAVREDADHGRRATFRQALSARALRRSVGIPRHQKVYPAEVALIFPTAGRAPPRQRRRPRPGVSGRRGDLRRHDRALHPLAPRHPGAANCARRTTARAPRRRAEAANQGLGNQHMPGEEVWLIGERRANGERKFYLSNFPTSTSLRHPAAAFKARQFRQQAHQQLKEELGLDHFEGRSWAGLHRHALMSMIAYAYLQTQRLAAAKGKKKHRRTAA